MLTGKQASYPVYRDSRAKLTPAQRDEIRRRLSEGESPQDLALEYGVTASTIRGHR